MPLFPIKSPPTATPDTAFWQAQLKEALTALHLPQPPLSLENFFSHPPSTLLLFSSKLQLLNCYSCVTTLEQMKHTGTVAQIRTIEMQGHCWLPSSARLGWGSAGLWEHSWPGTQRADHSQHLHPKRRNERKEDLHWGLLPIKDGQGEEFSMQAGPGQWAEHSQQWLQHGAPAARKVLITESTATVLCRADDICRGEGEVSQSSLMKS